MQIHSEEPPEEMTGFSGHLHQRGWKAEAWKPIGEISGLLFQKGWRSEAWKPRKFVLKGKKLYCYLGDSERSSYLIDNESFVTMISNGDDGKDVKGVGEDGHQYIFSVVTKNITTGYSMNKVVLSAPDDVALNSWIDALAEAAFDGKPMTLLSVWPKTFRNQSDLFNVHYDGRAVKDGNKFKAYQLERAPFATFFEKIPLRDMPVLLRQTWCFSTVDSPLGGLPADVVSQNLPLVKLFYTLIMITKNTNNPNSDHDGSDGNQSPSPSNRQSDRQSERQSVRDEKQDQYQSQNDFTLLWMVTNIRSTVGLSSDIPNGHEVQLYSNKHRWTYFHL